MSLEGKATTDVVLRGKIKGLDVLVINAYDIAVKNGFDGTEEEWLASLNGDLYVLSDADKQEIADIVLAAMPVYEGVSSDG